MCILCVIQKWSRRVATMLPWLVIPLIGLWALSQLLPPAFRFEITSPRLACVFVLLVTLFWYEVLMPQLSAWRLRRNAMLRERKRFEAIELQKLKKTAMRCCRNCLTPYRDQNPGGGGRFMCSYCGHVSKRPVLDLPALPGKMLNGQGWTDNGWMCRQEWLENGNWSGGSITGRSTYLRKNRNGMFGGDESCLAEKSYSGGVIFACRLLTSFFLSIRWLWRKIFRFSSSRDESSSDVDQRRMLTKRGENGAHCQESRGEKARRKAEEKRQARLEKELLEEEERKQREEVARLVEEQRRLRDEMMEAEKDHIRSSSIAKEKDTKKEADKKRQERRKEKDRCSSKSNSDAEELEKRAGKETEWKRELDKNDRQEHQRRASEHLKGHYTETGDGHGMKNSTSNNVNRTITSNRYFDRMKGTFLSSSKAFTGGSFFGKRSTAPVAVNKEKKSGSSGDFAHTSSQRRDFYPPEQASGKPFMNGDDRKINRPVLSELQPITQPKKSWHQLFTCSPPGPASSNANVISRPNIKPPAEVQNLQFPSQTSSIQTFDNPISFGLPSQFTIPTFPNRSASSSFGFSTPIEPILPRRGEVHHEFIPEATELFEDLRYVPDPVSLLGPVSESLDNFQLDLGAGFATNMGAERRPHALKNASSSSEVNKPSPIESPLSRSRVADDKHTSFNQFQSTPMGPDVLAFPAVDATACEKGTWQMWKSSPLGQEGLGLVGGSARWFLPPETNISNKEDFMHPSPQRATGSLFSNEYPLPPGAYSPRKAFRGNGQSGATFSPVAGPINHDPWSQNAFFSGRGDQFSLQLHGEGAHNEMTFGSPTGSVTDHSFEQPPANCWSKDELSSVEVNGMRGVVRPSVGGQFLKDVQFENKEVTF